MDSLSTIKQLIESFRVEVNNNHAVIYDLEEHLCRLISSIDELGFEISPQINEYMELLLFFQNQIKNKAQYFFKKSIGFSRSIIKKEALSSSSLVTQAQLFKLRIIYSQSGSFSIDIEPYTRDLTKAWQVKILDPEEFHIQTTDYRWKHKFYPRAQIALDNYDEVIWTNEHGHICEGNFTNVFFYNAQGQLCTPSLDSNILPGVMRNKLIESFDVIEGHYYPEDLQSGFFLVNSMFVKYINTP